VAYEVQCLVTEARRLHNLCVPDTGTALGYSQPDTPSIAINHATATAATLTPTSDIQPMRLLTCIFLGLALTACATSDSDKVASAVVTPLNDLNLAKTPIPELLQTAQRAPYALPPVQECPVLMAEIEKLTAVLGPDLDAPATETDHNLVERGGEAAGGAAIGALQRTAEGVIPFRGWVRKLSGAQRHSDQVTAAIAAGTARRAFLKGLSAGQKCG